jgi:hypothetical protein
VVDVGKRAALSRARRSQHARLGRAFDAADDIQQRDSLGPSRQRVSSAGPRRAAEQSGIDQLAQDAIQESWRKSAASRDLGSRQRFAARMFQNLQQNANAIANREREFHLGLPVQKEPNGATTARLSICGCEQVPLHAPRAAARTNRPISVELAETKRAVMNSDCPRVNRAAAF